MSDAYVRTAINARDDEWLPPASMSVLLPAWVFLFLFLSLL